MRIGIFIFKGEEAATTQAFIGADMCLASIRKHMPGVHVTQLTDDQTPAIPGVDKVLRRPACPLATLRTYWQATLDGDWVFCDADVVFQEDVRPVFEQTFDIALAERVGGPVVKRGETMEHNVGVVYSRSRTFWNDIHSAVKALPILPGDKPSQSDWFADQIEVCKLARSGRYNVMKLPARFNYAPSPDKSDALTAQQAAVLHFKGQPRKALMMERFRGKPDGWALKPMPAKLTLLEPLRVFIGYDPRQPLAYNVAAHSVASRSSVPVAITRLQLNQLPITARGLTEFTYSRFLAPWLCGFQGWSIFLDADVLCLGDIAELMVLAKNGPPSPVHVVGHQGERAFERASVMVFDNERCRIAGLTPEYVEKNAKSLLGLGWAGKPDLGLPKEWNHLVGYDAPRTDAKIVHFTMGIPCWSQTWNSEYASAWSAEDQAMRHTCSFDELMGNSVHVPHLKALR